MYRHLRGRFWVEAAGSSVSAVLLAVTVTWPSWIELAFGVDPDRGSGVVEWFVVIISLTVSVCASMLARREWGKGVRFSAQRVEDTEPAL
jgi:hypothetical protein